MKLTEKQKQRYLRNTILPEIGEDGQEKLLKSKVLVIGAGGLGSPVLLYLTAAGIGNIGIVDFDIVDLSNLQRQVLHNQTNLDQKKVLSAKEKLSNLNEDVLLTVFDCKVNAANLGEILDQFDCVIDATDNFAARFVINEICFKHQKTLIFGAVKGFLGQVSVFKSFKDSNPCYACFNGNIVDENFSLPLHEKGILGSVAGAIGSICASQTIKEILNIGESLVGKILIFDFLRNESRKVVLRKNPNCQVCKK